jgi:hypothetical protein
MLQQVDAALQARLGPEHDLTVTGEQAQVISLGSGVNPEERVRRVKLCGCAIRDDTNSIVIGLEFDDILDGVELIQRHNLNSTDAAVLHAWLTHTLPLRAAVVSVLVASDRRLLRAAVAEGLAVLNPETVASADVPAVLVTL